MNDALKNIIRDIKSNPKYFILIHNYFKSIGTLKPITYYDIGNDDLINSLMIWRNQNIEAYLNHEPATHEGTRKWLTKFVLDNQSKLLFIVNSEDFKPIGHMGIADGLSTHSYVELDNIVRGEKNCDKGIMTLALYDLISWLFLFSDCEKVYLRVFSDNLNAIRLYKNLKFYEKKKFPILKEVSNGIVSYSLTNSKNPGNKYFSYMELKRNNHFENYNNIKDRIKK